MSPRLASGATLIADDRLSVAQLEAFLLSVDGPSTKPAWSTPKIVTQDAWLTQLWARRATDDRLALSHAQSAALWRRVIASSADGTSLVDVVQIASWASDAWRLLWSWCIDYRDLQTGPEDPGFAGFLRWARAYDSLMSAGGWIDVAQIPAALGASANLRGIEVVWSDACLRSPAIERLADCLSAAGSTVECWRPRSLHDNAHRVALGDRREEIDAAVRWAQRKLIEDPRRRIALVAPPDESTDLAIARLFDSASAGVGAPVRLEGKVLDRDPAIGAALACISLASRRADFGTLSRCLRSPFLGEALEDRATRCRLEARLRSELAAQLPFITGYRSGLRALFTAHAPQLASVADTLEARLRELPRRQTATRWAEIFHEILESWGWPGSETAVAQPALDAWAQALEDLARLTPVTGPLDLGEALDELRAITARRRIHAPMPMSGLVVLSEPERLASGYDAAWITGMSDRAWPRPAQPNPLLPMRLQSVQGMPMATPAIALARSREVIAGLVGRAGQVVFSHSAVEDEFAAAPSPLIRNYPTLATDALPRAEPIAPEADAASVDEPADPVPPLQGSEIVGGAATLAAQARCPLRALIQSRLAARPLEAVAAGISARHRGIITHRALELLLTGCSGREELASHPPDELDRRIASSARRALIERARGAAQRLRVFLEIEQARLQTLLAAMTAAELERPDFKIEGLEVRRSAALAGLKIDCRIDRVDRLHDGRLAIIDYKTGRRGAPGDWLKSRLVEPQLPLYAQVLAEDVGALVFANLQAGGFHYRGIWDERAFPAMPQRLPKGIDWARQKGHWMQQLTTLAEEFASGDARILLADHVAAAGPFAPLTRVYAHPAFRVASADTE